MTTTPSEAAFVTEAACGGCSLKLRIYETQEPNPWVVVHPFPPCERATPELLARLVDAIQYTMTARRKRAGR